VLASKLRGIAILAGLLGLAMAILAVMPGRLVMYTGYHWASPVDHHEFAIVSAGGLVGALHAAALVVLAFRLWRQPSAARAWPFIVMAPLLQLFVRIIDLILWHNYALSPTLTGRVYDAIAVAELAIAIVVLPLALWLARKSSDAPEARALR
jgi:hypothetical protein